MRELRRWNYARHEYDPYMIPDRWKVSLYENDLETVVNCAQCGEEYTFGEMYTSTEIHNQMGFGYGVCEECYQQELNRRVENE